MTETIVELFAKQVDNRPDAIAVICKKEFITYRELDEKADRLADTLRNSGVTRDTLVPILLEDGIGVITAIIGILKAGGAFVPVDPSYPAQRIGYVLEQTGCPILITERQLAERLSLDNYSQLFIGEDQSWRPAADADSFSPGPSLTDLAYVIYTSGSTGNPKGVMVEHAQLITYLRDVYDRLMLCECSSYAILGTFSADAGYTAVFAALCFGRRLTVIDMRTLSNVEELIDSFEAAPVDCYKITPSLLQLLLQREEGPRLLPLKRLIIGGEACPWLLANAVFDLLPAGCRLFNHYGPTEATVGVITYAFPGDKTDFPGIIPLGKPLQHVKTHILREDMHPVTVGETGVLYIEGPLLARGYLKNPALTAERFIDLAISGETHRLYNTGDLVRQLPEGDIEYIGRNDEQVKVSGYRIELKEIETAALGSGLVSQCVVLARKNDSGGLYLAGYITPRPDGMPGHGEVIADLEAALYRKLPPYMVPHRWAVLSDWPLTFNNKIDRKALPDIASAAARPRQDRASTCGSIETALKDIWQRLLKIETIGATDNFFELGGNSLQLINLCFEIFQDLQVEVTAMELFEHLTIQQQAACLAQKTVLSGGTGGFPDTFDETEASETQKSMFVQNLLNPALSFLNSSISFEISGFLDPTRLELAFTRLIAAHESLRTTYFLSDGKVCQKVHADCPIRIEFVKTDGVEIDDTIIGLTRPFNFRALPMIRAFIIDETGGRCYLHIDMPHINSDGQSLKIIMQDLEAAHNGIDIARARPQYRDFQKKAYFYRHSSEYKADERFWQNQLAHPEVLCLHPGAASSRSGFEGTYFVSRLPPELYARTDRFIRANKLTRFQLFLIIYLLTLYKITSAENALVLLPVHNRNEKDLDGIVGLLSNVVLLRGSVDPNQCIGDYFAECSKAILEVLRHQRFPFERQADILKDAGVDIRNIVHSFFGFHQISDTYRLGSSSLKLYIPRRNKENLPLSLAVFETGSGLTMRWSSKDGFYDAEGLKANALLYSELLGKLLTSDPMLPVSVLLDGDYAVSFDTFKNLNSI